MDINQIIAICIFSLVMLAIISEKINRAVAAMTGALLMVIFNIVSFERGLSHIDFNTIGVLIGMMLFVSVVKNSGLFEYVAILSAKKSKGDPWKIMLCFIILTAILSAVLDNVTTVLLIGPMTIVITQILKINPVPFLITQILASNIGGTATLIGDPPNIMIGSAANLSFIDFVLNLGPVVVVILFFTIICFRFMFKKHLYVDDKYKEEILKLDESKAIKDKPLLIKSIIMIILILLGFVLHNIIHIESSVIALTGATVMMFIGKQDVDEILSSIEWSTIAFFGGLFVIVGGLVEVGIIDFIASYLIDATSGNLALTMLVILWLSAIISSFLDNIPFVATLIPLILTMQAQGVDVTPIWWATSLGACLGGNGTLIGASANIVLSNVGDKNGYPISFKSYFKIGFPLMLLSIVISTFYLLICF
ncbi:ArsB/NhaD family transporter [Paraclostridium sordellii]|uniref:ArsB/NhaD family transporter n=1 Tax=Paraclostridium sordellii TaxID=1505 RepID=UPI0005E1593B|nr:ArsB/NhaD family transporter [Paeniclostridium sordellii]CEO09924.1 symporter protein [[Clostridium] sordellii] [Paeniclostridium sordellii]CEP87676.1 symporter protein [[Clostridium] sordellii] [Paeniclostridium sordellii]CEP96012.1 symporter protein [[Clostridium] sordellii] [Paeniclostridium sordellii]CEP98644.1 symporter protein [[Clostridium] sordellii] [Paeniclostridium sordellii]CEQ09942.1 symporter protein [[Clostridium] sordellii] [Paeniclostridium sordellii]